MKKRLLSILLSLVMLLSLLPTTALAASYPGAASVSVDGGKPFGSPGQLYFKNGDSTGSFTGNAGDYNAAYDETTGILTLKDYNGGQIALGGASQKDLTIKLLGDNVVTVNGYSGILVPANGSNITITADSSSSGKLTINVTCDSDSGDATGIDNYYGAGASGDVTITGHADVTINTTTKRGGYGIYANNVVIEDHAKVATTVNAPSNTGGGLVSGIFAKTNVTINTDGEITVDASNAGTGEYVYSTGVNSQGNLTLTKVGKMTVKWNDNLGNSGFPLYPTTASFDSDAYSTTVDKSNKSNCIATYTPKAATPTATVGDVTITGTVGQTFTDQDVTITLVNDTFKSLPAAGGSVADLFPDLTGTLLSAKLKSVSADKKVLTAAIFGVADKEINKEMNIVIPADRLESGRALTVTPNPNAKFAVKKNAVPTSLKICREDGTIVTTDTLTASTAAQSVKYVAKVYDQYDTVLSSSYTVNWALTPSGSLSMSGSNPTQQMSLQLAANASAGTYTLEAVLSGTEIKASITISVVQPKAELLTAPTGKTGLKYSGSAQDLLATPGTAENGTLVYRVDPPSSGSYSADMPKATDAKTYKVWYYVKGNAGYADTEYKSIDVKIDKGEVEISNIKVTSPAEITTETNINDIKFSCDAVIAGTTVMAGGELSLSGGQTLVTGTKEYHLTFLPTLTSNLNVKNFIKFSLTVKAPECSVILSNTGTGATGAGSYAAGTTVKIYAGTKYGYAFNGWTSDDVNILSPSSKNASFIMPDYAVTVTANWTYDDDSGDGYTYYTIKASAGANGSISPSGNVSVREGWNQTFTITPDKDYAVAKVLIDNENVGAVESYTFAKVKKAHTIEVVFMKASAAPQTGVFMDVPEGSYYEEAVRWAVEKGIATGTGANTFAPNGICTRAQAVTFLWRAAGSPAAKSSVMPFTDVKAGSYYYDAVLWAVENGITVGTAARLPLVPAQPAPAPKR